MKRLWELFDWLNGIEFAVCGVVAATLLIGGPAYLIVRFVAAQHYLPAMGFGLLWCACLIACIRDLRRRRFTWLTGGLVVLWFATTLWVSMSLS